MRMSDVPFCRFRQIGVYLQQYQNRFNGKIPVYTIDVSAVWWNYHVYNQYFQTYVGLGLLVPPNIVKNTWKGPVEDPMGISQSQEGRVFYCPTTLLDAEPTRR